MRNNANSSKIKTTSLLAASLSAVFFLASGTVVAQTQKETDAKLPCVGCAVDGKTPRMPDEHPNLSGYWNTPRRNNAAPGRERGDDGSILFEFGINFDETIPNNLCVDDSCQVPNQPPYNAAWMPKVKAIADTMYLGTSSLDPEMACKPNGVPRTGVGAMQILQNPQVLAILYESAPSSVYRVIYLDGRSVPADFDNSYMGFSVGHWEADTLVINTSHYNDDTWLGGQGHGRSKYTSIHSEKMTTTERWTRQGDTLTVETTVEDPAAFTKPWVLPARKVQISSPSDYLHEAICSQENASGSHMIKPTEKDKGQLYNGAKANAPGAIDNSLKKK
jgi:hypothetical protein